MTSDSRTSGSDQVLTPRSDFTFNVPWDDIGISRYFGFTPFFDLRYRNMAHFDPLLRGISVLLGLFDRTSPRFYFLEPQQQIYEGGDSEEGRWA